MKSIYLIILLSIFTACKNDSKNTKTVKDVTIPEVNSKTLKMLQGTWVNMQDTLSTISFDGNTSKNSYKGVANNRSIFFTIGDHCEKNQSISTGEKDKYLTTTGAAEECYYIKSLNETKLELMLVAENITLQFKKK